MFFCRRKETYFRHLTKNSKAFVYALVTAAGSPAGVLRQERGLGLHTTDREGRCRFAAMVQGGAGGGGQGWNISKRKRPASGLGAGVLAKPSWQDLLQAGRVVRPRVGDTEDGEHDQKSPGSHTQGGASWSK